MAANNLTLVPTIDISAPIGMHLDALDSACRNHGFFLLSGHGLEDVIDRTWTNAIEFFELDTIEKRKVMKSEDNPLGWFDREMTKQRRDRKEVFDYFNPNDPSPLFRNRWPAMPKDFRSGMTAFHETFSQLAKRTTELVHAALGLEPGSRNLLKGIPSTSTARLNYYVEDDPVPENQRGTLAPLADVSLGAHTDAGILTLLLQDEVGGLQAQCDTGEWVDIVPTPGTIVVNIGDMMQVWTNDRYRAAVHRVLPIKAEKRISIPYFFHPSKDAEIRPHETLVEGQEHYRPFSWLEYVTARSSSDFADTGKTDAYIDAYRITS